MASSFDSHHSMSFCRTRIIPAYHHIQSLSQASTGHVNSAGSYYADGVAAIGLRYFSSRVSITHNARAVLCDCDSRDVRRSACRECKQPWTRRHVLAEQRSDNSSRAMDKKRSQISCRHTAMVSRRAAGPERRASKARCRRRSVLACRCSPNTATLAGWMA